MSTSDGAATSTPQRTVHCGLSPDDRAKPAAVRAAVAVRIDLLSDASAVSIHVRQRRRHAAAAPRPPGLKVSYPFVR
jgi:hypothetical protein